MHEPSITRRDDGAFDVRIARDQRDLLRDLPAELGELLSGPDPSPDDPAIRRLFPSADLDDPDHASEFDHLVRGDLLAQRNESIETMRRTIDADRLTEDELTSWLSVVNDVRLVLGTRLDVTEETTPADFDRRDPQAQAFALYGYLSYLEETMVEALSGGE